MNPQVALVNMPFFGIDRPSLGLSLLKAALAKRNIPCTIHYFNLWFAKQIGIDLYKRMDSLARPNQTGEWVFSAALCGLDQALDNMYTEEVLQGGSPHHRPIAPSAMDVSEWTKNSSLMVQEVLECRNQVEPFLEHCLEAIDWKQYRIIGFSSMFQQQLAALALASRLKKRFPHLVIVFGGSNCEDRMGVALFETFPFIDAVCSGEGDLAFPEFVEHVLAGTASSRNLYLMHREIPGVKQLTKLELLHSGDPLAPKIHDMDSLPYPDFDEFFSEHTKLGLSGREDLQLLIETSRGCWWGETSHCTFCGLNGSTMTFRHKSVGRAVEEILWLLKRYGEFTRYIQAVDNIIPVEYFSSLLPTLEKLSLNMQLFYETKSNLKKDQVELCGKVGLTILQPGIESLSTPVLQLMGKGVTSLQNIQLLKWCRQFGVNPIWNYLIGFPGETPEHYADQAELIDSICHLPPPYLGCVARVRFDRFSPYFTRPAEFGISNLRPYPSYQYLYPGVDEKVLNDLAYYFVGEFEGQERIGDYAAPLNEAISRWHANREKNALFAISMDDQLFLCDFRPFAQTPIVILTDEQKVLYEACDSICTRAKLLKRLTNGTGQTIDFDAVVRPLLQQRLLLQEEDKFLALAIPLGFQYVPTKSQLEFALEMTEEELETRAYELF